MGNQIFKSAFFNSLRGAKNEWAKDAQNRVTIQFDEIAYKIESSGDHNKRVLEGKCQNLITCWKKYQENPREESNLWYAYYSCYTGLFSELKGFEYLVQKGYKNVCFLEEGNSKTPDFYMDENVFCEVKNINPPKKEECRRIAKVIEAVEIDEDFKTKLFRQINGVVQDSIQKFEAVKAPLSKDKRLLLLNVILGNDALDHDNISTIFTEPERKLLETKHKISIAMIVTFSI